MKVLVCGNVNGQFSTLVSKLNSLINKNGTFDMLFCVGDFFGDNEDENQGIEENKYKFPLATYILGPNKQDHVKYYKDLKGYQLCTNVTYLGQRGTFKGLSNLNVAFFSGVDQRTQHAQAQHQFNSNDVSSFEESIISSSQQHNTRGIDIFITSQWPDEVDKYAIKVDQPYHGSPLISRLALTLKPRYHFSSLNNIYYERLPYRNHMILAEKAHHVTRFIALANFNNKDKRKFLYAFSIDPLVNMDPMELNKQPADATEVPYNDTAQIINAKRDRTTTLSDIEPAQQFFYSTNNNNNNKQMGRKRASDDGKPQANFKKKSPGPVMTKHDQNPSSTCKQYLQAGPDISLDTCWFCLSNPQVEKHLVISVGDLCYLALAKGGLNEEHVLIIPVNHHQSITNLPADVISEVQIFKKSLTNYFKFNGKCVVFFERNYKTSHMQLQGVPLPERVEAKLKDVCVKYCKDQGIDLLELPEHSDLTQIISNTAPYFYIELPENQRFFFRVQKGFEINFGRMLLCQVPLLNEPEKIDWRNCQMTKEQEEKSCTRMRQNFKTFDPFV